VRQDAQDHTEPHLHKPCRQSQNPQQTEQGRTDRRGGTALLTGGLLVRIQPEEPIFSTRYEDRPIPRVESVGDFVGGGPQKSLREPSDPAHRAPSVHGVRCE
jgi:hypothetical protein